MLTKNREVGMLCFLMALAFFYIGFSVMKKGKTNLIPRYKDKGANTALYCSLAGKGILLAGVGMLILSVPLSLENPDKYFALVCLICCFLFIGMGIFLYLKAEKL